MMDSNPASPLPATDENKLILMRGLPSCGKSWTARQIAEEQNGEAIEFDSYFVQSADETNGEPTFRWRESDLPAARKQQFTRVKDAIKRGVSPIVVDDDHRPGRTAKAITAYALLKGYKIEFAEPTSTWWQEIRGLLADKNANAPALEEWAQKLAQMSRGTHNVSLATFTRRIASWQENMTVLDLLTWNEPAAQQPVPQGSVAR
jgi:predicted kinase